MNADARRNDAASSACLVLLADDDADGRSLLARALRRAGCSVVEASDGAELLAKFAELRAGELGHAPDVVVSDVHMPRCDGLTATAAIVRAAPGTPVVLVTAFDDAASRLAAMRAGAAAMIGKPLDPAKVASLVRALASTACAAPAEPST